MKRAVRGSRRWATVLTAGLLVLAHGSAMAQVPDAGVRRESLRLRLTNSVGGRVEASADGGLTWRTLGQVTAPANTVSHAGYTAASWARDSAVAATAVNAIHFKVAQDPQTRRAIVFSLVPGGRLIGAANRAPSSAIETDITGGTSLFGAGLGPYVDSPVYLVTTAGEAPLPAGYVPHAGDVLLIRRLEPARMPLHAVFENRAGGAVLLDYGDGPPVRVGRVDHPVTGIGRFEGTLYAAPGRIRANHPGVIDVSTSPFGMMGGFQVIPRRHALSPEMISTNPAQWLVIGPDDPAADDWAGLPPFFADCILPSYRPDDITGGHPDWEQRVLSRFQVQVRLGEGPWRTMPRVAFTARGQRDTALRSDRGRHGLWLIPTQMNPMLPMAPVEKAAADEALTGVTALRLVFPRQPFWPDDPQDPVFRSGASAAQSTSGVTEP